MSGDAAGWHLAQINVGTARFDLDDPGMAGFMTRLDEINALADTWSGFVWRLQTESGNATDVKTSANPRFILNMSVWASAEALFDYVYRSEHRAVMARRREWFERPEGAHQALWWVEAGRRPTAEEGLARLARLNANGPTPDAFTFKTIPAPGGVAPRDLKPEPLCAGWA